jgi:hypothetical protein
MFMVPPPLLLWLLFWWGGGRANGFGGPLAPAESRADAEGDGGGKTTPDECESVGRRDGWDAASVEVPRGDEESAVALPPSEGSSGIWTLRRGRAPPATLKLLERDGGVNVVSGMVGIEPFLTLLSVCELER